MVTIDELRDKIRRRIDYIAEKEMRDVVDAKIFFGDPVKYDEAAEEANYLLQASMDQVYLNDPVSDFMFHGTLPGGNKAGIDPALPDLTELYDKVADLSRKIDLIFGDHVLINGKFINIKE